MLTFWKISGAGNQVRKKCLRVRFSVESQESDTSDDLRQVDGGWEQLIVTFNPLLHALN